MSRSSRWAASEPPSSEDLDHYPATDTPTRATPSTAKSPSTPLEPNDGPFDLVIFDPPFRWFTPRDLLEQATADLGYRALRAFFAGLDDLLAPDGRVLLFTFNTTDPIEAPIESSLILGGVWLPGPPRQRTQESSAGSGCGPSRHQAEGHP